MLRIRYVERTPTSLLVVCEIPSFNAAVSACCGESPTVVLTRSMWHQELTSTLASGVNICETDFNDHILTTAKWPVLDVQTQRD